MREKNRAYELLHDGNLILYNISLSCLVPIPCHPLQLPLLFYDLHGVRAVGVGGVVYELDFPKVALPNHPHYDVLINFLLAVPRFRRENRPRHPRERRYIVIDRGLSIRCEVVV